MLFHDKENGKTHTLKEFSELLVKNKELINTETIVSRELQGAKEIWIIDTTGTAYKIDQNKFECYEQG